MTPRPETAMTMLRLTLFQDTYIAETISGFEQRFVLKQYEYCEDYSQKCQERLFHILIIHQFG